MNHIPPKRQPGWGKGARRMDGEVLDVSTAARDFFGGSEDLVRSRAAAGLLPHRRWGGRIVFLRSELIAFFANGLPGITLEQARANVARRGGE